MDSITKAINDLHKEYVGAHDADVYNNGYNDALRDVLGVTDAIIVHPKYKGLVMAALKEAYQHELLGSIGDKDACSLYHRLGYENYCRELGKDYDELTEEDFEIIAMKEAEKAEAEVADRDDYEF